MHPYIPFLLEDIKEAHRNCPCGCDREPGSNCLEEELLTATRLIDISNSDSTLSDFCDLYSSDFPPSHQLNDEDICHVIKAMECFLVTWHVELDLPEDLPHYIYYKYLIKVLDKPYVEDIEGYVIYDFCDDAMIDDELKDWCSWKNYMIDIEMDDQKSAEGGLLDKEPEIF